ncbi:MAG: HU family DNA-binding protein [Thermodesulfobacteriota bacterium]|jgi:DNA-binding protein HU-beta
MTRADLVSKIADGAKISKVCADQALSIFIESVTKALKKGDKVTLVGFGTFSSVRRKARKGRNPRTGEIMQIKARKVPKFVPGKLLKEKVR